MASKTIKTTYIDSVSNKVIKQPDYTFNVTKLEQFKDGIKIWVVRA